MCGQYQIVLIKVDCVICVICDMSNGGMNVSHYSPMSLAVFAVRLSMYQKLSDSYRGGGVAQLSKVLKH